MSKRKSDSKFEQCTLDGIIVKKSTVKVAKTATSGNNAAEDQGGEDTTWTICKDG